MFKPVREVAFTRLANEGAHRGEILRGASIEELFQIDPAEFFVSHNCAHGYKPPADNALSRRRLSIAPRRGSRCRSAKALCHCPPGMPSYHATCSAASFNILISAFSTRRLSMASVVN